MGPVPGDVTILLQKIKGGDQDALAELVPLVYKELWRLAGHLLREERVGHTLQPTALVHEAYLCLAGQDRANWQNRAQFMAVAAQIMRHGGMNYLGICAGAFFAGNSPYNRLNLTSGARFGFYAAEARGIRKAPVAVTAAGGTTLEQLGGWTAA
jgi:glutamine amidotransferase-like uncharacterized protein